MRDMIITSSILIMAILIIRRLVKGKIHPLLQYSLWLIVVFKLLMPMPLWSSPISILNLFSYDVEKDDAGTIHNHADALIDTGIMSGTAGEGLTDGMADSALSADMQANAADKETADREAEFSWSAFLMLTWLAGMITVGGYMLFYQIKWQKFLRNNRRPINAADNEIVSALGISLSVYIVNGLPSPCLIGRSIYLTQEMAKDKKHLEHILAHEYCHYRQLDSLWAIIRCVLTVIYWFNPLVWAAAYISKQDSELACDAAVIRMLGEDERIPYGKTLINLSTEDCYGINGIGAASMMGGGEKRIRERIFKIARRPKYIAAAAGVVILIAAVLIAVTFSGAGNAPEKEESDTVAQTENGTPMERDTETVIPEEQERAVNEALAQAEAERKEVEDTIIKLEAALKQEQEAPSYTNPCPSYTRISDGFGKRVNPITKEEILYEGIDFAAEKGEDIVASADGTVYETGFDAGYGNYIILHHGAEDYTYYGCCDEILAAVGDSVVRGQKIATVGSTGRSTGPHLHFMVESNGAYVEPVFNQDEDSPVLLPAD